MFRKRSVYEKGDSISNCIFDGHQFPDMRICEGKEKIYLDSSWKYADHARITSGYAVMYKAKKEPEGHCDCSQCGTWDERRFIGQNAVSSGWLCKSNGRDNGSRIYQAVAVSDGMAFRDGTAERDVTFRMAQILKKKLLAEGYDVLMVRDGKDVQLDNVACTVICNNVADCHIALHWDSDGLFL